MIMSPQFQQAQEAIADMEPGDPGDVVSKKLIQLKKEAPDDEAEYFDMMWEAYTANL